MPRLSSDVGAALAARSYGGGSVVFEVADAFLPENAGRWKVEGGAVERTETEADLALDVGELGAAYLGGFPFAQLVRAGTVCELKEGGAARADAVFLTGAPKPWCPEIF
jgi:predicted acetyltransferase